ncbi:MAG: hypothetical protein PF541_11535, partial [Prolixibacteraceae bacterium]|nr:hypothetical protein [Prolixibacteraceae bacterium]
ILTVTFGVVILDYTGILAVFAAWFEPFFTLIGLPGKSALVLLTSVFANIYSAIAVITTLGFEYRSALILAVMCLISHAFIIEAAVIKKTGSNILYMLALRLIISAVAGVLLNFILPDFEGAIGMQIATNEVTFAVMFLAWLKSSSLLIVKVIVLIVSLMFFQKLMEEFGIINYLIKVLQPFMKVMGLPESTTFSWIVANMLGLSYGSAIIISQVEEGKMNKKSVELLNNHIVVSHSLLEDPLLFVAIGLPLGWLIIPRLILAIMVVWLRKLVMWLFQKSKYLQATKSI